MKSTALALLVPPSSECLLQTCYLPLSPRGAQVGGAFIGTHLSCTSDLSPGTLLSSDCCGLLQQQGDLATPAPGTRHPPQGPRRPTQEPDQGLSARLQANCHCAPSRLQADCHCALPSHSSSGARLTSSRCSPLSFAGTSSVTSWASDLGLPRHPPPRTQDRHLPAANPHSSSKSPTVVKALLPLAASPMPRAPWTPAHLRGVLSTSAKPSRAQRQASSDTGQRHILCPPREEVSRHTQSRRGAGYRSPTCTEHPLLTPETWAETKQVAQETEGSEHPGWSSRREQKPPIHKAGTGGHRGTPRAKPETENDEGSKKCS